MKGKRFSSWMAVAIMTMAAAVVTGCGKKDKKVPLSRQADALRSIKMADRQWKKSATKRSDRYYYRVDASQFTEGNPPAQILVGIDRRKVACRKLMIGNAAQWVEKGNDINGRENYPFATTVPDGLETCLEYAEEEFTENFEFDYALTSEGALERYGCYYKSPITSRPPKMIVAPRRIVEFDPGVCNF